MVRNFILWHIFMNIQRDHLRQRASTTDFLLIDIAPDISEFFFEIFTHLSIEEKLSRVDPAAVSPDGSNLGRGAPTQIPRSNAATRIVTTTTTGPAPTDARFVDLGGDSIIGALMPGQSAAPRTPHCHDLIAHLVACDIPIHTFAFPRARQDTDYFVQRVAPVLAPFEIAPDRIARAHKSVSRGEQADADLGFEALLSPLTFTAPDHLVTSGWVEHAPFAFWLTEALRPSRFVELGVHNGYSYFAICQAVKTLGLETHCHGIDTWLGDAHSGFYGEDVFDAVKSRNAAEFAAFSDLLRRTFDEAVMEFEDNSIDLLHIDGRHFYHDVTHDFESWLPKLSDRSVVLIHDTRVLKRDFGVHRFWAEVNTRYPSFEFYHGHGLGVLGVGANLPAAVASLFSGDMPDRSGELVRMIYASLGAKVAAPLAFDAERRTLKAAAADAEAHAERLDTKLKERDRQNRLLREELSDTAATQAKLERAEAEAIRRTQEAREAQHTNTALRSRIEEAATNIGRQNHQIDAGAARLRVNKQQLTDRIRSLEETTSHLRCHLQAVEERLSAADAMVDAQAGTLSAIHSSTSWRVTAPVRWTKDRAKWLGRNGRRTAKLFYWLGTGQLTRARTASLPYRRWAAEIVQTWLGSLRADTALLTAAPVQEELQTTVSHHPAPAYAEWIARNDTLTDEDRALIRNHTNALDIQPKFSIVMPVYDPPPQFLRAAIESVQAQLYENWELCIADDASPSPETVTILEEFATEDPRLRLTRRAENGGISACSNTALATATGDWIVLMDHDDLIAEHALYLVAEAINRHPDAAILYSDEDRVDGQGQRSNHYFKPDWDYDLFLGQNFINHLGVYRADLVRRIGGFREGYDGSQDWDFALRVHDAVSNPVIVHIPFVLYHWRHFPSSFSESRLASAAASARRAVNDHLTRTNQAASVSLQGHSSHLLANRNAPASQPPVSVVVPTRDHGDLLRVCIDGLINKTDYANLEIVLVDNGTVEPDALAFLKEISDRQDVTVLRDPGAFNYSRLVNLGVAASTGEVCVLLNNDIDVINPGWLSEMVRHAVRPGVGAVGAKLFYPDDTLQHGGVILGLGGIAGHAQLGAPGHAPGYQNRLNLTHNLSCVTAACLATRKDVYEAIGGFREQDLTVAFNDVDFCIRLREAGYRIVWTPRAALYHLESASRGHDTTPEKQERSRREQEYMLRLWGQVMKRDPYFNPNLDLFHQHFVPAKDSRVTKPWRV